MGTARAKYQTTAPGDESREMAMKNPRRHFKSAAARAPGKSGGGTVKSGKRSTYKSGYRD
jgi:hypothetical protein